MNLLLAYGIIVIWAQIAMAHATIVVLLGRPWKQPDPLVSWVLTGLAVAGAVENANLFVAALVLHRLNLGATFAAYLLSAVVVDTLLVLLIRLRVKGRRVNAYAKGIAAAVSAGLIAAQTAIPMSAAAHGWVSTGIALAGFVAVYGLRNAPLPPAEPKE